jgi:hypothetical protein
VKRLVTLLVGLSLALPAMHWEAGLFDRLNAALGDTTAASAPHLPDVNVPHALEPLIHALDHK